jgi:hypothetical protein
MVNIPSSYQDPGSYSEEKIQPGSVAISSERILGLVAIAPRTRRATNEAVIRGKIYEESLTTWSSSSPYTSTLAQVSNRNRNDAVLRMNGNALGVADWSFVAATLTGTAAATVDTTTTHWFTLSMDGKDVVTLELTTKGVGTAIATIASELNTALAAESEYGSAYSAVFTVDTNALVITSPITTSASDIKVLFSFEDTGTSEDCASVISGGAWVPTSTTGVQAASVVQVIDSMYYVDATYDIDYVAVDIQVDPLTEATASTPLSTLTSIGSYPSTVSYTFETDYEANGNTVDWYIAGTTDQASLTGRAETYNIVLNTNDHLYLSLNGLTTIDVTLTAGAARTAAQIVAEVGAALSASAVYGPEYSYAMIDSSGSVKLDMPKQFENFPIPHGSASSITLVGSTSHPYNAATTLFNVTTAQLPYSVYGTGSRPTFGSTYYATYEYTRASTDYDTPHRVYNSDQLYEFTSPLTVSNYTRNKMAIAAEIAFDNFAPSVYLQLINDATVTGSPTQTQINTAIDNCGKRSAITDVVVIDTAEATQAYLMSHVSNMSTMLEKKPRRGWNGCARDTAVGDPDTPDSYVYRATTTLQPPATSTGRGRQLLVAPANITRVITLEDNSEISMSVDGSYLATAVAALSTSLPNPSSTMVNLTITGFDTTDFETFLDGERKTLAGNGVFVVTLSGGNLVLKDPLTTEAGGVPQFEEPMASAQKDSVSSTINDLLDSNVVGLVPDDLSDFIVDIKLWIMLGLQAEIGAGNIAPFRDNSSVPRDVDPTIDIQVFQSTTDPRTYIFYYWFNLKYPAKRFFGQYSVDNPFFGTTA